MTQRRRSGSSSKRKYSVFEFGEEDERVEKDSKTLLGKFHDPNCYAPLRRSRRNRDSRNNSSPVTKYNFLKCFAACSWDQQKEGSCEPINVDDGLIDIDTGGPDCKLVDLTPICVPPDDHTSKSCISASDVVLSSSLKFENEPVGVDSDDDDSIYVSPSSTSTCSLEEGEGPPQEQVPESGSARYDIDQLNNEVIVSPDFILYQDVYCTQSSIAFSSSCIKVEGSTINGTNAKFDAKWAISDVIHIESEWSASVDTAMVFLHFRSKVLKEGSGSANETSGVDKLKFSVYEPLWSKRQAAIKSLNIRYKNVWNEILGIDKGNSESGFLASNGMAASQPFSYLDGETFEAVIYPEGDPDAVTISLKDVELLQPEKFLNDTIIDFYIKYLKNKFLQDEQHRFHFFNSFFFRKLVDLDKDQSGAFKSRASFLRVHKWTKKVNLFEKDYIFIPVNYSLHWSLIVICHLCEVANFTEDETKTSGRVPCILHMDSIRGSHRGLKKLIQSYLYEEWKERHNKTADDMSSKCLNLRFIPLELPQQQNSFDCGLFLLHYVECFLHEVPTDFSPLAISRSSKFLKRNWFFPKEASLKRAHIRKLICKIFENHSKGLPLTDLTRISLCSEFPTANELKADVEFLEERYSSQKERPCSSSFDTEVGHGFLPSVSSRVLQRASGLSAMDLPEPGTSARSIFRGSYLKRAYHWMSCLSPVEEAEGHEEHTCDSFPDKDCYRIAKAADESPRVLRSGKIYVSLGKRLEQKTLHLQELDEDGSTSGTILTRSPNLSEIRVAESPRVLHSGKAYKSLGKYEDQKNMDLQELDEDNSSLGTILIESLESSKIRLTESPRVLRSGKIYESIGKRQAQKTMHLQELDEDASSSGRILIKPPKSSDIGVDDNDQHMDFVELLDPEETGDHVSSSTASEDLAACVVEDSQESDSLQNCDLGNDTPYLFPADGNNNLPITLE